MLPPGQSGGIRIPIMKKLTELNIGDTLLVGDIVVEQRSGMDVRYTVYKSNPKTVSAYSEYMKRRTFPLEYAEGFKGHMCKYPAKVYRYDKN